MAVSSFFLVPFLSKDRNESVIIILCLVSPPPRKKRISQFETAAWAWPVQGLVRYSMNDRAWWWMSTTLKPRLSVSARVGLPRDYWRTQRQCGEVCRAIVSLDLSYLVIQTTSRCHGNVAGARSTGIVGNLGKTRRPVMCQYRVLFFFKQCLSWTRRNGTIMCNIRLWWQTQSLRLGKPVSLLRKHAVWLLTLLSVKADT